MKKKLQKSDKLSFGKHKGRSIRWILENDPQYIRWIFDNKIQSIEFDPKIKIPDKAKKKRRSFYLSSSGMDDLDREYASQRRDEYPSTQWGEDGDYYPNGCDIYGFG